MITTEKEVIHMMTVHEVSKISGVSIRALQGTGIFTEGDQRDFVCK